MSRWKIVALGVAVWLVASVSAGGMGTIVATTMVTEFAERGAPGPSDVPYAGAIEIESFLGETRHATVHLADFYARDTDTRYPVWVVLAASGRTDATVYLNLGDEDGPMRTHFDHVVEAVADTPGWTAEVVPGASHAATPRLGTATALRSHYGPR